MFLLVCQKIVKKLVTGHFKIKSYVWINNNTNRKSHMIGSSDWLNPIEHEIFPQSVMCDCWLTCYLSNTSFCTFFPHVVVYGMLS